MKWGGSLLLTLGLMAGSAWATWEWQANAHGRRLAIKETAHLTERTNLGNANSEQIMAEQGKRLALEQWLAASDQSHYRALTDEKTKQARLRDRLATADLRLSVLLDATGAIRKSSRQVRYVYQRIRHQRKTSVSSWPKRSVRGAGVLHQSFQSLFRYPQ